jgi:hypothetical protein
MLRRALVVALLALPAAADEAMADHWDKTRRESFALKKEKPLGVAVAIRMRFGFEMEFVDPPQDPMDFKQKDVTFFEAIDRLGAARGYYLVGTPQPPRRDTGDPLPGDVLSLVKPDRPLAPPVIAYMGPSRLSVESLSVLAVTFCAPPRAPLVLRGLPAGLDAKIRIHLPAAREEEPRLRLSLKWIVEPGFEGAAISDLSPRLAIDDRGSPLVVVKPPRFPVPANGRFHFDLERPAYANAKAIRKFEGTARIALPLATAEVIFQAAEAGTTKPLGGAGVKLVSIEGSTAKIALAGMPCGLLGVEPQLAVGSGGAGGIEDITLVATDAEGKEVEAGNRSAESKEGVQQLKVEFDRPPAKFVFRAVVRIATRDTTFAFGNIPLPE